MVPEGETSPAWGDRPRRNPLDREWYSTSMRKFYTFLAASLLSFLWLDGFTLAVNNLDPAPESPELWKSLQGTAPFRLVGSGDSILKVALPLIDSLDRFIVAEPCRAPFTTGCDLRASTVTEIRWMLTVSAPGGFVLVQDGGVADRNGVETSDAQWRIFTQQIVSMVPDDRTIIWVHNASRQFPAATAQAYRRAVITAQVFASVPHQRYSPINMFYEVSKNPALLSSDGLHLSTAGSALLAARINALT
nr:unknown [uncultured bacterium]